MSLRRRLHKGRHRFDKKLPYTRVMGAAVKDKINDWGLRRQLQKTLGELAKDCKLRMDSLASIRPVAVKSSTGALVVVGGA